MVRHSVYYYVATSMTCDIPSTPSPTRRLSLSLVDNFPTRGPHTLDQIFTNFAEEHRAVAVPPLGRSDHCVILWQPSPPHRTCTKRKVRKLSRSNVARFMSAVVGVDWTSIVKSVAELDQATSLFLNCLHALFEHHFPAKR